MNVCKKSLLLLFLIATIGFTLFAFTEEKDGAIAEERPNILVILADDLGYGDLQCYNPNSQVETPHLDRLSQEGVRFTDAHSGSAVCSPTRYGLVTGRYAFRSPLKQGVLGGYSPPLIEADRFTIANLLKQAGYETGVIGKWHLGLGWPEISGSEPEPSHEPHQWPQGDNLDIETNLTSGPAELGFDYSFLVPSSLDIPPYLYLENGQPSSREIVEIQGNNEPRGVFWRTGRGSSDFKISETLDHLGEKAQEYIVGQSKREKPFFLYLPLTSPHTPWLPSDPFQGQSGAGTYGDFVAHTDAVVGRVLRTLDSLGLKDNTLVVFTSDNGADWKPGDKEAFPKHRANGILRGQKSDIWEGGHRVPFIVRWPQKITKHKDASQTVCINDLMATLAAITQQKLPANAAQDSYDFSPVLATSNYTKPIRPSLIHHSISGMFSIRKGKWKYVEGSGSGGWSKDESPTKNLSAQLYDMENDPAETRNLLKQNPKIATELKVLLTQQREAGYTRPGAKK
ncbi:arylsulfatase [Persicitalea sp.]|uniref:sulfatase family protein n=1 Tax=Persicitalea sp. TaxID=3100273 RepID=UPI00359324F5